MLLLSEKMRRHYEDKAMATLAATTTRPPGPDRPGETVPPSPGRPDAEYQVPEPSEGVEDDDAPIRVRPARYSPKRELTDEEARRLEPEPQP